MNPKVEKLRTKIADLKNGMQEVEGGYVRIPKAMAIERLKEHLASEQSEGLRHINHFLLGFTLPDHSIDDLIPTNATERTTNQVITALLPADPLLARLTALMQDQYADAPPTMAPSERAAWLKAKAEELLKLEAEDFRESNAAREPQRPDLDARVLLGIA